MLAEYARQYKKHRYARKSSKFLGKTSARVNLCLVPSDLVRGNKFIKKLEKYKILSAR
jgi:hypothetical protein